MTERNAPFGPWAVEGTTGLNAETDREMLRSALIVATGRPAPSTIVNASDLLVTASATPDQFVHVAAGQCFINGSQTGFQGLYHGSNDAPVALTITAPNASNPRHDLIVGTLNDSAYTGGGPTTANQFKLAVITGTPAATPVDPTVYATSIVLARISMPAGSGTAVVTSGMITDLRPYASRYFGKFKRSATYTPTSGSEEIKCDVVSSDNNPSGTTYGSPFPFRLTIPQSGIYLLTARISWSSAVAGVLDAGFAWTKSGAVIDLLAESQLPSTTYNATVSSSTVQYFVAGDTVAPFLVFTSSVANLRIVGGSSWDAVQLGS